MSERRLSVSHFLQNLNTIEDYALSGSNPLNHTSHHQASSSSSSSSTNSNNTNTNIRNNHSHGPNSSSSSSSSTPDDELAIFANTQFFDFDMGCSTDIAATMDDLLMQQEHQLQKSKPFVPNNSDQLFNNISSSSFSSSSSSSSSSALPSQYQNHISSDLLDLSNLQQFSLANELLPLNNDPLSTDSPNGTTTVTSTTTNTSETETLNSNSTSTISNQQLLQQQQSQNLQNLLNQHEYTDPLTLTTQPRLSHIMSSPALNSMISNGFSNTHHNSLSHTNLHQPTFSQQQSHQNHNNRQPLTASQQLHLFIQQQIQAHGKINSSSLLSQEQLDPPTSSGSSNNSENNESKPLQFTFQNRKGKSVGSSPAKSRLGFNVSSLSTVTNVSDFSNTSNFDSQQSSTNSSGSSPSSKRKRTSRTTSVVSSTSSSSSANEEIDLVHKPIVSNPTPVPTPKSSASTSTSFPNSSTDSVSSSTTVTPDEDKRRRNTAASARFRVKKKLREQEMEKSSKELQDKVKSMETKIMQLEMENKWLKSLVVEKNEVRNATELYDLKQKILEESKV